eukprot:jgi/Hompol1/5274/HPOL_004330-RA
MKSDSTATASRIPPFNVVNRHNLATLSLTIKHILSRAHHVAVDTEFTGLGDPKLTRQQNIDDRYRALANVARTHALVALGLSIFELPDPSKPTQFAVHNFQFLMLSRAPHSVGPSSLSFLVENGFDFNDQIQNGIPYSPGDDIANEPTTSTNAQIRSIFNQILICKLPIVVHNGFLDLMFLYQSFYATLPPEMSTFIADMNEMFLAGGVYDTKYISEFVSRESRTFLSYLFRKYERQQERRRIELGANESLNIDPKDRIQHLYTKTSLSLAQLGLAPTFTGNGKNQKMQDPGKPYCEQYAAHGVCVAGSKCSRSHDLDLILDWEEREQAAASGNGSTGSRSKKRKADAVDAKNTKSAAVPDGSSLGKPLSSAASASQTVPPKPATVPSSSLFETYHSACYDAYMTGFTFAHQMLVHQDIKTSHRNRLYLIGKPMPLRIEQSLYAKTSEQHKIKAKQLKL